jgi:2-oxoglutarate ferredoxin oxidoreductase subunit alpha
MYRSSSWILEPSSGLGAAAFPTTNRIRFATTRSWSDAPLRSRREVALRGRGTGARAWDQDMPALRLEATNDFVIKFANVNGSGSASANRLFARSFLRMGVPIASRNIFPSNIQGLPTWYEIRVTEAGHLGRRGGVDLMVAMNPQTWDKDTREIEPGGYLFYDSTRPMPPSRFRSDIHIVGMPLTEICNEHYSDPRQRQLFKNIIYVGALASLLGIEIGEVERLIAEQFRGKDKLIPPNHEALHMGRDYAEADLKGSIGLKVQRADAVGNRIFLEGNDAAALGAVYGGATVAAWYPITPSTSLAEAFAKHCRRFRTDPETGRNRYAIVQAEDELASIGMVIGAAWNGARAFTATSGPGISLMQEFIGLAYFAEVPAVIFDVQRGGPSTGMPTRTQQSDILISAYASHGDTKHVLLFPEDPRECFEFGALAFDLADRLQTPIFVLLDLDIGMNEWLCEPLDWDDSRRLDRGKVLSAEELEAATDFGRYLDIDRDGIPFRTYPGTHPTKGSFFTRGTSRDPYARYTEEGGAYVENVQRLLRKFETAKRLVPSPICRNAAASTRFGAIYFGSTAPAMNEAIERLQAEGIALDLLRVRAFPFADEVIDFVLDHDQVFVIEQNRDAQLRMLLINEGALDPARLISVLHYDGTPITARFITGEIARRWAFLTGKNTREAAE